MKKSFLLRTVSGILLCSYSTLSYAYPEMATTYSTSYSPQPSPATPPAQPSGSSISHPKDSETGQQLSARESSARQVPTTLQVPSGPGVAQPVSLPLIPASVAGALSPERLTPIHPLQDEKLQSPIESVKGNTVTQSDIKIRSQYIIADAQNKGSIIKLSRVRGLSDFAALNSANGGHIDATDVTMTTREAGLLIANSTMHLKNSTVVVTGDGRAYGILIKDSRNFPVNQSAEIRNKPNAPKFDPSNVVLENTKIFVERGIGIGIYGPSTNTKVSLKDSEIHADALLKNTKHKDSESIPGNTFTLTADHSLLKGGVRTLEENKTVFDLKKGTKWFLNTSKNVLSYEDIDLFDREQFGFNQKSYSNLSTLKLADSAIVFDKPMGKNYQTLFVGSNLQREDSDALPVVYSTIGTAEIHLNSQWSENAPVTEQETDRLLISGDVSGSTVIHINLLKNDKKISDGNSVWREEISSLPLETQGVSVIQVSGKANKNSFKLANGYTTIDGSPYKYILASYAPGTSHASQNLFGRNDRNFWDFRVQNDYIDKDKKVRALLPQVVNYILTPGSLFSAGFSDMNNQNVLLDDIQATVFGTENDKKKGIFLSSYGERVTLSSDRGPLHYGYGADVNYNAVQMGIALAALESKNIRTHFGILGTHGKLSFTPKDMEDSEKTTLNKWSFTIYNGIQHSNGVYVNTLLSYSTLKGDVTTALSGNVAKLDGTETLNLSATLGKKLATATKGLTFEPQMRFMYQKLMFDDILDVNNLKIDMGNPHQWLIQMGGRLTQTLTTLGEDNALAFYSRLNVIKTFGDDGTIKITDTFYLDPTGASVEGGVGVNAYFSKNIALHGDISYRKKLQKTGVSGTSFSGGVRYRF
ncbi:autotransporter outer membrane beta-barrel domain-containing protein [Bartonella phoceensis]|uniref:autotransporter outer membrane beta-barrel domain-containing protein n=1 Tax=Bartonella phoceensis TaxID=270249 RepID=UPI001ABA7E60|nr:autotransporter outer membrane beta-barrel domain-containing protein [Bartonella phoceensis]